MAFRKGPEGFAIPDNQGNLGVCTRFAVAKALANGFRDKEYFPKRDLDFSQREIALVLVNEHKVGLKDRIAVFS